MYTQKQFKSGEWDIKLNERINGKFSVKWNWFKEQDIMIPLLKADAIKRQYGNVPITLECNYLPYSRQDRVFELGQPIAVNVILDLLLTRFSLIQTMALHNSNIYNPDYRIRVSKVYESIKQQIVVYPDENAKKHYCFVKEENCIIFNKKRYSNGIKLTFKECSSYEEDNFLICDDICDGGRTFIECAKALRNKFKDCNIELMIYHGFMTHDLNDLKNSGISKICIINPDSYEYLIDKFPDDKDYFNLYEGNTYV